MGQIFYCKHVRSPKTKRAQKDIVVELAAYSQKSLLGPLPTTYFILEKICLLIMVSYALKSLTFKGDISLLNFILHFRAYNTMVKRQIFPI